MAKIRHVESDNEGALSYWSGAMREVGKFKLTNGRTTRIIVISICDALSGLGQTWLVRESLRHSMVSFPENEGKSVHSAFQ